MDPDAMGEFVNALNLIRSAMAESSKSLLNLQNHQVLFNRNLYRILHVLGDIKKGIEVGGASLVRQSGPVSGSSFQQHPLQKQDTEEEPRYTFNKMVAPGPKESPDDPSLHSAADAEGDVRAIIKSAIEEGVTFAEGEENESSGLADAIFESLERGRSEVSVPGGEGEEERQELANNLLAEIRESLKKKNIETYQEKKPTEKKQEVKATEVKEKGSPADLLSGFTTTATNILSSIASPEGILALFQESAYILEGLGKKWSSFGAKTTKGKEKESKEEEEEAPKKKKKESKEEEEEAPKKKKKKESKEEEKDKKTKILSSNQTQLLSGDAEKPPAGEKTKILSSKKTQIDRGAAKGAGEKVDNLPSMPKSKGLPKAPASAVKPPPAAGGFMSSMGGVLGSLAAGALATAVSIGLLVAGVGALALSAYSAANAAFESQRHLASLNGDMAVAFAQRDISGLMDSMAMAEKTAASTATLGAALSAVDRESQGLRATFTNAVNSIFTACLSAISPVITLIEILIDVFGGLVSFIGGTLLVLVEALANGLSVFAMGLKYLKDTLVSAFGWLLRLMGWSPANDAEAEKKAKEDEAKKEGWWEKIFKTAASIDKKMRDQNAMEEPQGLTGAVTMDMSVLRTRMQGLGGGA